MKRLNLCIAYPNKSVYSETFIHNHIKHLEPSEKIYGGWFPIYDSKDKCILRFPLDKLIIRGILKRVSSKSFHKIYTQYLSKFLYKNNINVVLAEYGITGCSIFSACKILNIPLIVHFHGFYAFEFDSSFRIVNRDTEGDLCSLSEFAFDPYFTVMRFNYCFCNAHSETCPCDPRV